MSVASKVANELFKLPDEIIPIPNADKKFHEKWNKGRGKLNIPHPFRATIAGPPNVGKSTIAKNLIIHQNPPFEDCYIIHCDAGFTEEYDDLGRDNIHLLDTIPPPDYFPGKVKTIVVCDDLEFKGMSKDQKAALDRLFGYVSTHKNISVILCAQDPYSIPPIVRRCSNLFILFKGFDIASFNTLAHRVGIPLAEFKYIFDTYCKNKRDSFWIDVTDKTPYRFRINGSLILERNNPVNHMKQLEDGELITDGG